MTGAAVPRGPEDILWYEGPAAYLCAPHCGTEAADHDRGAWRRGVALGAVGRYAEAAAVLGPLIHTHESGSLALSTLASHARQVGRHQEAADLDGRALELARTDEDRADATSGLVADALGQGDAPGAVALVRSARAAAHGWRGTTRLHWVAAELALLRDLPDEAVAEAQRAVDTAQQAAAPRHVTKSTLVRGVARKVAGDAPGAHSDLLDALTRAEDQGLPTLDWPAAAVLAELEPAFTDKARSALVTVIDGLGE
ncbi:MAG TPA: hypothetical protein VIJ71_05160, partial [Mycobacteriales bacterium]